MSGGLERNEKLTTDDLIRIATILGHLAKDHDLYSLLFETSNKKLLVDGTTINTKDLMWFVILDNAYARGWFWNPKGKMTSDTSVCAGVPLAFLGAKRVFNKSYSSWLSEDLKRVDIFLPQGLNTWRIDETGNQVLEQKSVSRGGEVGLIKLHMSNYEVEDIHGIREQIILGSSKPRKVKGDPIFNKCSYLLRCMIAQSWCWAAACRNSDMITDYRDWDKLAPSVDASFQGLKPKKAKIAPGFLAFVDREER